MKSSGNLQGFAVGLLLAGTVVFAFAKNGENRSVAPDVVMVDVREESQGERLKLKDGSTLMPFERHASLVPKVNDYIRVTDESKTSRAHVVTKVIHWRDSMVIMVNSNPVYIPIRQ